MSKYISFINHLYTIMKKYNIRNTYVHICFQSSISVMQKIAHLDDIANLEILPYGLHFSEVMSFTKIIKDVDG